MSKPQQVIANLMTILHQRHLKPLIEINSCREINGLAFDRHRQLPPG